MRNPFIVSSIALSAILAAGCSGNPVKPGDTAAPTQETSQNTSKDTVPLVGKYQVHRFTLPNGFRILVVEDHSSPTLAYQTWFRVGSRDEVLGRTGLAHLFEHMMFKETKSLKDGEFDKILESAGAEGENAFTSRDYTAYVQEMPSDKLDLIMRLESDRMVNLVVNEQAFKTETQVVQNERRFRLENNPDGLMYQEIFGTAFTKHPYRWPVIGSQEDLEAMKGQDALEFYRAYYSPNHATLVVAGDVNPEQVLEMAKKYYGHIPSQASPTNVIEVEPPQDSPRRKRLKLSIQVEKLMLGYHIPGILSEDMAALDVLGAVLSGGKSSRLHRALVDTGLASSVGSYDLEDKDPSLFLIMTNLQKGKKAAQAEAVILKEIARIIKEPVSQAEIDRAKNRISFGFFESMESNSEKANFLGHYEAVAGDFSLGLAHYKQVPNVTAAQVQAVAVKYFDPKNRTVITGVKQ